MHEDLGQIFTKDVIARYMVNMLSLKSDSHVLDPCFGKGIFIDNLLKETNFSITGIELDRELYSKYQVYDKRIKLQNCDFLSYSPETKFDGVVMNPPYIRHERINELKSFCITKDKIRSMDIFIDLPMTANIYMYFVIKALEVVKIGGEIIVIFPVTWMNARSGESFKKTITKLSRIEKTVYVKGNPFEEEALVDVVILKIIKTYDEVTNTVEVININNNQIEKGVEFNTSSFISERPNFLKYASARRGLTTGNNGMYINPSIKDVKYLLNILSSPKSYKGYSTSQANIDLLLNIQKGDILSEEISKYINTCKCNILEKQKPKVLYNRIIKGDKEWYKICPFDCRGIILSYIIRDNMKFVLNTEDYIVRDNFYVIKPLINNYLLMALLNNYYTFYQLEKKGKKYGAGLLKLQKYDIEELILPTIELMDEEDIRCLISLAQHLVKTSNESFIDKITKILSKYEDLSYETIRGMYFDEKSRRLEIINGN